MTADTAPADTVPSVDPLAAAEPAANKLPPRVSVFDRAIDTFVNVFGSRAHFFLALCALPLWILPMVWQGYAKWTALIGLTGNTYESTIEYYLGVATLYQAARITIRQAAQQRHSEQVMDHIETMTGQIATLDIEHQELLTKLGESLASNTDLTQQVHALTEQLHASVCGPAKPS